MGPHPYVTNLKSNILEVNEVKQIIIISPDRLIISMSIYDAFQCEITVFITFFSVEKIEPWPRIEPAMSRPTFSQIVEPIFAEMEVF